MAQILTTHAFLERYGERSSSHHTTPLHQRETRHAFSELFLRNLEHWLRGEPLDNEVTER